MLPHFILTTFNIGPVTLYTWGVFAGVAFAAALYLALKEAKRKNINEDHILDLAILVLIGGVAGARAFFVVENWSYYSENMAEILSLNEGGMMFYGGAIGALTAIFLYIKLTNRKLARLGQEKISLLCIADALVPSFAAGELIGRIGCTLSDLHLGAITALPWGQKYIDGSVRHPVSIYMAFNGLLMLIVLWLARLRIRTKGALFLFFVLWYSGTRFFLDFLRCSDLEECDPHYAGFTPSQYISAGIFIFSLTYLIIKILNNPPIGGTKFMEEIKKDEPKTAEEKFSEKNMIGDTVFKLGELSGAVKCEAVVLPRKNKYWIGAIIAVIAFTAGAGALSGYYERYFKKDIFSFRGKTWVAYSAPIVNLTIVNDATCKDCSTEDLVKQLKSGIMPTLSVKEIDYNSKEGKDMISKFSIKSLPALIFDNGIEKLDNFNQMESVLTKKDGQYYLNSLAAGLKPGKFLETIQVQATDRVKGPAEAPVTIIEFSDFQCPYCKIAAEAVKQVLAAYPDKVRIVYKNFPLTQIHANAQGAAEAAECAGDQGKFWEMHDLLFANQDKLDAASIGKYATQLKLNKADFDSCVSTGKFKAKVEADSKVATDFGVGGTPAFFINGQLMSNEPTADNLKAAIDAILTVK